MAGTSRRRNLQPPPREEVAAGSSRAVELVRGYLQQQARIRERSLRESELAIANGQQPVRRGVHRA